jgi:hypothetical protein
MFKKIKDFIKAFKDAYNTVNTDKINARKAIDDFKKEVDDITYIADSLKFIFARLEAIYSCFPIKERQDFILKTLDLLRYGRRDANGGLKDVCGWYALYSSQVEYAKTKLKDMNKLYKKGKYSEVISLVKGCNKHLEEFNVLYGIEETLGKNNK